MVWYLSRATGAPCPFAKAGIRLSDYGENGKVGVSGNEVREKKRTKMLHRRSLDPSCGQKRKRSLRSCTVATAATATTRDSATDSESEHDEPPPKVKLTLRLKPLGKCTSSSPTSATPNTIIDLTNDALLSDSDSDSDSAMSMEEEPESPLVEFLPEGSPFDSPASIPLPHTPRAPESRTCYPSTSSFLKDSFRRSPSATYSISSPPPESDEEEEEDSQLSMTCLRQNFYGFSDDEDEDEQEWDEEGEVESDADGETLWESPGPRSPSVPSSIPPLPNTRVKEEPRDVQEMLDAWDHFDSHLRDARMAEVIAQAAASLNSETIANSADVPLTVKVESQDAWDWQNPFGQRREWEIGLDEQTIRIKQEDLDLGIDSLFPSMGDDSFELESESLESEGAQATFGQRTKTAPVPQTHVSSLSPISPSPSASSSAPPQLECPPTFTRSTAPSPHALTIPPPMSPGAAALVQLIQTLTVQSPTTPVVSSAPLCVELSPSPSPPPPPSVPPSSLVLTPTLPQCVPPQAMKVNTSLAKGEAEGVVVHTCQPCSPAISATQIEGKFLPVFSELDSCSGTEISVYQMPLGPYLLLRRIDTDFVNLTPIVEWCGKGRGYPVLSTIPNAVVVWRGWGSDKVCGVWVPLEVAQSYVKDLNTCLTNAVGAEVTQGLDVFLSNELVERFPSALKDFHRTNSSGRMLKQFGRWFESMVNFAHAQAVAVAAATAATANTPPNVAPDASSEPLNPQNVMQADSRPNWTQKDTVVAVSMTGAIPDQQCLERSSSQVYQSQHRRTRSSKEEDRMDVESPLSAKEEELFQELCVIPGEEEERVKAEMQGLVDGDISRVAVKEEDEGSSDMDDGDLETESPYASEESQQTSGPGIAEVPAPETKVVATRTMSTRSVTTAEKQALERQEKGQILRRSKRVADALAAQTQSLQPKTRSRKKPGSRNTLS
jgi:hypothetical protein